MPTGITAVVVFHIRENNRTANAPPDMNASKIARMTQFQRFSRLEKVAYTPIKILTDNTRNKWGVLIQVSYVYFV